MGIRAYNPAMLWQPTGAFDPRRVDQVLRAWEGTRYESGQRYRQRGADCIGAIFGVVDDLDGRYRAAYPGMPQDTSMHNRATAIAAVRELVRRYEPCFKVEPVQGVYAVEGGDIVVTGSPGGGPGHVEMVGVRRNELWHCTPSSGFHQGGWSFLEEQVLYAVYRIGDKHRWK